LYKIWGESQNDTAAEQLYRLAKALGVEFATMQEFHLNGVLTPALTMIGNWKLVTKPGEITWWTESLNSKIWRCVALPYRRRLPFRYLS
jgi:hypothetical protein